jgi:hypothetical protein
VKVNFLAEGCGDAAYLMMARKERERKTERDREMTTSRKVSSPFSL